MKVKFIFILCLILLVCGCAAWQLVQRPYQWKYSGLEAMLPAGWMKFNSPFDLLFLTKDGETLQNIRIYRYKINKKNALPISKKTFTDTMLPQEISELIVNELSLDETKQKLSVKENIPYDIGGKHGFRIEYSFNTRESLKVKTIIYGFKKDGYIYLIQYQSAEQYYFAKDLKTFKDFVNSFKVIN